VISVHLKKLRRRSPISAEEEQALRGLVAESRSVPADQLLVRNGVELNFSILLLDGWLGRFKDLPGGDRQVTQLHVAGDFADLHGFTLKRLDHDVVTLSDCEIAIVPHNRIADLVERFPRLARLYWFATNVDAAITRELALSLGRRSALSRMAHLFCELYARLDVVGKADHDGYAFPLTQRELAECLGLTVVHANRTLQELRRRQLIELEGRRLTIVDRDGLQEIAEFDPDYLYLERMPF
jgi:CRP-like cAMP-binding protein